MFGSMFRDFDNDPFFSDIQERHRQQMSMMNSMFQDPFMAAHRSPTPRGPPMMALEDGGSRRRRDQVAETRPRQLQADPFAMQAMSPFGMMGGGMGGMFGNMNAMMGNMRQNFERMANDPNTHMYSSSSVTSYSNTGDGAPKVYQASTSTRKAPGGVKETRQTVRDSEKGLEKMAIGHHLGDRAHIIEKSRDARTGAVEENQEFLNLDENEAGSFNNEFTSRSRSAYPNQTSQSGPMRHTRRELPALTDSRREHRENRTRHGEEYTPPRPSGPSRGGRKYDNYDRKSEGRRQDKYSTPSKSDKGVHF